MLRFRLVDGARLKGWDRTRVIGYRLVVGVTLKGRTRVFRDRVIG